MPRRGGDAPLSLADLELEFEATLRRLARADGADDAGKGPGMDRDDDADDADDDDDDVKTARRGRPRRRAAGGDAHGQQQQQQQQSPRRRRRAMQEFLARQKQQETALRKELAASQALDDELTQEALMAELRGIQFEMDEYSRMRSARRRLARSMPPQPRDDARPENAAVAPRRLRDARSASQLAMGPAQGESVTRQMDVAVQRALQLSREHELEQREAAIMEDLFERENANLEMILRTHYERTGMKHLEALGRELSERRRRDLAGLRASLEDENEALLQEMREEFEARLANEKDTVRGEYEQKRQALREELRAEFSQDALDQEVENYRLQAEHRIGEELAKARREEEARQRGLVDKACAEKLAEKETELARAREAVCAEFAHRRERTLRDLERALQEGARESQLALVAQLEEEVETDVQARESFWEDRRSATLSELRDEQSVTRSARIEALDAENTEALEAAVRDLREAAEAELAREVKSRIEASQEHEQRVLAETQAQLEANHAQAIAELVAAQKRDLEAAEASKRSETLQSLQRELETERERLQDDMETQLNNIEKRYEAMLTEARTAFAAFRERAQASVADAKATVSDVEQTADQLQDKDGIGHHHDVTEENDEVDDEEEEDKKEGRALVKWKIPHRVRDDDASERLVLKLLQNAADGHHELAERLRQANRKVSKLGKELVLMRQTKAADLAELKRQLHEARQTIQKLFQANRNLSSATARTSATMH